MKVELKKTDVQIALYQERIDKAPQGRAGAFRNNAGL